MFSVENVIGDYYPDLAGTNRFASRRPVSFLRVLFHETEVQQFEQTYSHLAGFDFIDQVLSHFDFSYSIRDRDFERIPQTAVWSLSQMIRSVPSTVLRC